MDLWIRNGSWFVSYYRSIGIDCILRGIKKRGDSSEKLCLLQLKSKLICLIVFEIKSTVQTFQMFSNLWQSDYFAIQNNKIFKWVKIYPPLLFPYKKIRHLFSVTTIQGFGQFFRLFDWLVDFAGVSFYKVGNYATCGHSQKAKIASKL